MDSPLRTGAKLNARYGGEALLGSATETSDGTFDLLVAIPAPAAGATFVGPYSAASLEFPGGTTLNMRTSQFSLASSSATALQPIAVTGHAANLGGTAPPNTAATDPHDHEYVTFEVELVGMI